MFIYFSENQKEELLIAASLEKVTRFASTRNLLSGYNKYSNSGVQKPLEKRGDTEKPDE